MKRVSWKYLAGLIDGEGCIDVQVTKIGDKFYVRPRLRINMANAARELLETFKLNFGGVLCSRTYQDRPAWSSATS